MSYSLLSGIGECCWWCLVPAASTACQSRHTVPQTSPPFLQLQHQLLPLELASFFDDIAHKGVLDFLGTTNLFKVVENGLVICDKKIDGNNVMTYPHKTEL